MATAKGKTSSRGSANTIEASDELKHALTKIRNTATQVRETVKAFRDSGVIKEVGDTILETAETARDTTESVRDTAVGIKKSGAIEGTVQAAEETMDQIPSIPANHRKTVRRAANSFRSSRSSGRRSAKALKTRKAKVKMNAHQLKKGVTGATRLLKPNRARRRSDRHKGAPRLKHRSAG